MNSGRLRHRIEIQRRVNDLDALGEPVDQWQDVATIWAEINDLRGREYVEDRQAIINEVTTSLRLRYRADLLPEMRVRELCHARRAFEIVNIRYEQAPRPETLLECEERRVEVTA